uniref:Mitochondrial import receptor subunit TOM5 homolog n=1 Tax=Esox lucius TaxID=8010 RepID=A0AAY5K9A0_ESOLU
MLQMEGLGPIMDPEEMKRKMRQDVLFSVRNFLLYVALLRRLQKIAPGLCL